MLLPDISVHSQRLAYGAHLIVLLRVRLLSMQLTSAVLLYRMLLGLLRQSMRLPDAVLLLRVLLWLVLLLSMLFFILLVVLRKDKNRGSEKQERYGCCINQAVSIHKSSP